MKPTRSDFIAQFVHWFDPQRILLLARQTRWHIRQGKIEAFEFLTGLAFGQMSALRLTLNAQAMNYEETVSRQAVNERYHQRAVDFFRASFDHCLRQSLAQKPPPSFAKSLAEHFPAVHVVDSTSFDCPASLARIYPGCGGDASPANCKMLLRYEYIRGQLEPLALLPGKRSDQGLAVALPALLAPAELILLDKGFLNLEVLQQIAHNQAYFLMPCPRSLRLYLALPDGSRQELNLAEALRQNDQSVVEWPVVYLGAKAVKVRVVAFALSDQSAARHRAGLRESQRKQGRVPTAEALELAAWMILITNAPADKLPVHALSYLYRVRWQIELIFKQCKSVLRINVTEAIDNPFRIQCEIWARLIAAVVLFAWHGYLQAVCWLTRQKELSFAKMAHQLQQHGLSLAQALMAGGQQLKDYLWKLFRHLLRTAVKGRQQTRKTTRQNLDQEWLGATS